MYVHIHIIMHIYIYIYVLCIYTCICMYVCMYIYIYIICMYVCMYVCMYIYIYIYIHTPNLIERLQRAWSAERQEPDEARPEGPPVQQQKVLVVAPADAGADPRAVVVHAQDAEATLAAVVGALRALRGALRAPGDLSGRPRAAPPRRPPPQYMYTSITIMLYIYIYIYISREREREIDRETTM